jgi:hypothetical protein
VLKAEDTTTGWPRSDGDKTTTQESSTVEKAVERADCTANTQAVHAERSEHNVYIDVPFCVALVEEHDCGLAGPSRGVVTAKLHR